MNHFVYITRQVPEAAIALLRAGLPDVRIDVNPHDRNLETAEIVRAATGCDALICTLADPIDAALIKALSPRLCVIATYAVGFNNIDLEAAKAHRVAVCNTPDVLTEATAEIAIGLMLACARGFLPGDRVTRAGEFKGWAPMLYRGHGLYGKTVGIVGPGRIGGRVARTLAEGFGCRVLYHARNPHPELPATQVDLDTLLAESDFVSLHCPLTPETRHLINARRLRQMKPTAVLVNTARGPVVDEAALVEALKERVIAGAGLDVYEAEPALAPGLSQLENAVLLPHIGSATHDTRDEMGRMCARAVVNVLQGKEPDHRVV
jgi:glyoxylate reductase